MTARLTDEERKDRQRTYNRRYTAAHSEQIKAQRAVYRQANLEKIRARQRLHYAQRTENEEQRERRLAKQRIANRAWRSKPENRLKADLATRRWKERNPERVKAAYRERAKRPKTQLQIQRRRDARRRWRLKNVEKANAVWRLRQKFYCDNLTDTYVINRLKIPKSRAPKSLIEAKRAHLKLLRLLRTLNRQTH